MPPGYRSADILFGGLPVARFRRVRFSAPISNMATPTIHNARSPSGFTLIELLVVMMLVTIVLSVTLPRFGSGVMQDPQKQLSRWMINTTRALRTQAMEKQTIHALMIDLDANRMWTVHADMDEESLSAAAEKGFSLSGGVRLVNVQYPDRERVAFGTAEILFYPAGYADQALIHFDHRNTRRFTFQVEPLLPKVRLLEGWVTF